MKKNTGKETNAGRRRFIRQGLLAGIAGVVSPQLVYGAKEAEEPLQFSAEQGTGTKSDTQTVTILITSDIHSQFHTHDEFFWENNKPVYKKRGGLAVLKTMIEAFRKKNPASTILYDGGDFFHGHAVASLTEGEALIPVFNKMGYDLMLPGNWEVVYKKKKMLFDMGHTNAAKICANMFHKTSDADNNQLVYPPFWIKYAGGIKIGFIGYTDHLIPKRQAPAYSEGLRFEHAENNVARYISYLRETENCQVVILATHMGLAQQVGLANNPAAKGADFIIGADTHERVREPILCKYAKVIECGAFGSFLGKLDIVIKDGQMLSSDYRLLDVDPAKYAPDKEMQQLVNAACSPFHTELSKVLGYSSTPLVRYFVLETPMDNLLTDAIRWKFKPDIALSNGFRFCQPLAEADSKGMIAITREFMWNMLPVNSEVRMGSVTGQQLWDWLEKELQNAFAKDPSKRLGGWFVRFSGMEVNFTIGNELGKRVNLVKVGGQPLDPAKTYTVAACEREGDPEDTICRIEKVKEAKRLPTMLHDVLEEYLKVHSPVSPKVEMRASATDEPQTLLTQLRGTTYDFR